MEEKKINLNSGSISSQSSTNNNIDLSSSSTTIFTEDSWWGIPTLINIVENNDSIEMIYKQTSMMHLSVYPPQQPQERVDNC